jgi:itaconyl-CoA hydratase
MCLDAISMDEEGPFFDDFRVGMQFRGKVGRTVTETDNVWFTLLTGNSNQIHFNEDYTRRYFGGEPFNGRRVVNGFLTMAIAAGILVDATSRNGFQVGIEAVRFTRPVFHGDTLYSDAEVTEVRESRSRPGFGLIRIHTRGLNERGDPVVEFDRVFMVRKRGEAWRDARPE